MYLKKKLQIQRVELGNWNYSDKGLSWRRRSRETSTAIPAEGQRLSTSEASKKRFRNRGEKGVGTTFDPTGRETDDGGVKDGKGTHGVRGVE